MTSTYTRPNDLWPLCKAQETERYKAECEEVAEQIVQRVLDSNLEDLVESVGDIWDFIEPEIAQRPRFQDVWGSIVVFLVSEHVVEQVEMGSFEFLFTKQPPYLMQSQTIMEWDVFCLLKEWGFNDDNLSKWRSIQEDRKRL